jgi:uncharacterized protein
MTFVPYILLAFSILLNWVNKSLVPFFVVAATVIALATGRLNIIGVSGLIIMGGAFWLWKIKFENKWSRLLSMLLFYCSSYLLFSHIYPGFNNFKYFDQYQFSVKSAPFNMFLNYDKPFIGVIVLYFLGINKDFINSVFFKVVIGLTTASIVVLLGPAIATSYIKWEPKVDFRILVWMLNNLIFVCVAEEVLFRRLIQKDLGEWLKNKTRHYGAISLICASLLFGLSHYKGGVLYIVLSTLAGLFYGYAYLKTDKIESSILVHFLLNTFHIIFFTYPFLKL